MSYADIIIPFAGGLGMFIYGMQIIDRKSTRLNSSHSSVSRMRSSS